MATTSASRWKTCARACARTRRCWWTWRAPSPGPAPPAWGDFHGPADQVEERGAVRGDDLIRRRRREPVDPSRSRARRAAAPHGHGRLRAEDGHAADPPDPRPLRPEVRLLHPGLDRRALPRYGPRGAAARPRDRPPRIPAREALLPLRARGGGGPAREDAGHLPERARHPAAGLPRAVLRSEQAHDGAAP